MCDSTDERIVFQEHLCLYNNEEPLLLDQGLDISTLNNGNSNIFSGLQPGIYNFQVQDTCGNIVNRLFDITTLPEPSITASNLCQGQSGELSIQALSFFNVQWYTNSNFCKICCYLWII